MIFIDYHLLSLVIIAYHWFHWLSLVSLIIIDYHWLSLVLIAYHWLSMVIIGYHWLSSIIIGFHWLSWIFKDYLKIQKGESLTDSLTDWNQEVQAYLKKVLGGLHYSCSKCISKVAVMDPDGHIVEAGVEVCLIAHWTNRLSKFIVILKGELVTRGYSTMLGYWGDKAKTDEVIGQDRWFHTG